MYSLCHVIVCGGPFILFFFRSDKLHSKLFLSLLCFTLILPFQMASKPVTGSDSLLLGAGYTPSYGINESYTAANGSAKKGLHSDSKERWSVVAYCALAACTISMVTGMSLGFSSILINELNSTTSTIITPPEWRIGEGNTIPSLIGVRYFVNK